MASPLAGRSILLAGLFSAKVEDPQVELAVYAAKIVAQGGTVLTQVVQRRGVSRAKRPGGSRRMNAPLNPATYFGRGKAREIGELRRVTGAELVVVGAK